MNKNQLFALLALFSLVILVVLALLVFQLMNPSYIQQGDNTSTEIGGPESGPVQGPLQPWRTTVDMQSFAPCLAGLGGRAVGSVSYDGAIVLTLDTAEENVELWRETATTSDLLMIALF